MAQRKGQRSAYLGLVRTRVPGMGVGQAGQRGPREQELGRRAGARLGSGRPRSVRAYHLRQGTQQVRWARQVTASTWPPHAAAKEGPAGTLSRPTGQPALEGACPR